VGKLLSSRNLIGRYVVSAYISMRTRFLLINLLLLNILIINTVILFMRNYRDIASSDLLRVVILLMMLSIALYAFGGYGIYKEVKRGKLVVSAGIFLHLISISYVLILSPNIILGIAVLASMVNCSVIGVLMLR